MDKELGAEKGDVLKTRVSSVLYSCSIYVKASELWFGSDKQRNCISPDPPERAKIIRKLPVGADVSVISLYSLEDVDEQYRFLKGSLDDDKEKTVVFVYGWGLVPLLGVRSI